MKQNFDNIWENILSKNKDIIKLTFNSLNNEEQKYIIAHLTKMVSEDGWHPTQIENASFALQILASNNI